MSRQNVAGGASTIGRIDPRFLGKLLSTDVALLVAVLRDDGSSITKHTRSAKALG